jgi:hypothetical protein
MFFSSFEQRKIYMFVWKSLCCMSVNPESIHITILSNDKAVCSMEPKLDNMLAIKCIILLVSCYALLTQYSLIYSSDAPSMYAKNYYLWWPKNISRSLFADKDVYMKEEEIAHKEFLRNFSEISIDFS